MSFVHFLFLTHAGGSHRSFWRWNYGGFWKWVSINGWTVFFSEIISLFFLSTSLNQSELSFFILFSIAFTALVRKKKNEKCNWNAVWLDMCWIGYVFIHTYSFLYRSDDGLQPLIKVQQRLRIRNDNRIKLG